MSRKRRVFDIEMPDQPDDLGSQSTSDARRGPMASAVRENADSLRDRAETEKAIRAENDALAHEYVRMKGQGLVIQRIPLNAVLATKLTRDRHNVDDQGLEELCDSIRAIGLSNPIQVERCENGFELVQGLRRLSAFRHLEAEMPGGAFSEIPAVVLEAGETLEVLYRRMVDENLIRSDVSFAEMAALARAYAGDDATTAQSMDEAVHTLFGSVGKQKRSYIRAFARLLDLVGPSIRFPNAIPRALGLSLRKRIEDYPETLGELQGALSRVSPSTADEELGVLREFLQTVASEDDAFPAGNASVAARKPPRPARTTFQVQSPIGPIKCTASQGRLELKGDTDFSALERRRLEDAVNHFLKVLENDAG